MQTLVFTNSVREAIAEMVEHMAPTSVHVVTDENVARCVLPSLALPYPVIEIAAGDESKNLEQLAHVWSELIAQGATRHSLVLNIGGGVVTDLGGFAAATFKRGVRAVNIPTTLLAAVDAAVGGKTGINFGGLKNEVGAFAPAEGVIISTRFFASLPAEELRSGYAEMIKHGLLEGSREFADLLDFDIEGADAEALLQLLERSVRIKERIVTEDPTEKGIRRALNLGHTAGHAFESLALERKAPVPHGYAVAWGMLVELILSNMKAGLASEHLYALGRYLRNHGYGSPCVTCDDYPKLVELMRHDKKNLRPEEINFTLLSEPGMVRIDQSATAGEITAALDIFRDMIE